MRFLRDIGCIEISSKVVKNASVEKLEFGSDEKLHSRDLTANDKLSRGGPHNQK